ncbi:MAG: hypothetical protein IT342_21925 [Candidatus Melainabacteria bacterium]|nr:hypothetical protein [Candidatus Melainabacteria bacterium]
MGDPAIDITNNPLAIEGLEAVFDLEPVTAGSAEPVTCASAPVTDASEPVPGVPVEQAAVALGSSINAIKKRLRKGTLRGSKVETKHGEKWFVAHSELAMEIAPAATMLEPVATGSAEPVTCASAPVTDASEPVPGMPVDLIARIRELETKLEGATFRNGYLEAENEGLKSVIGIKDSHIKLLTDSQHKRGWWASFSSWFFGGR